MRRYYILFMSCVLLYFIAVPVSAEFYEYIDKNGIVHYTNDLTTVPREYRAHLSRHEEIQSGLEEDQIQEPGEPSPDEEASAAPSDTDEGQPDELAEPSPGEVEPEIDVAEEDQFEKEFEESVEIPEAEKPQKKTQRQDLAKLREQRSVLESKKTELNKKLEELVQEKQKIKNTRITPTDQSIEQYNQNVKRINDKIKQFKEEDSMLREEIEAFNETVKKYNTP